MTSFYRQLADKHTPATGLRMAKLEYLGNQRVDLLKHPYFWSGFVFYAQNERLGYSPNIGFWSIALAILILLGLWYRWENIKKLT